ncbi:MAG: hypothetical protein Q9171_000403 [Xanthocarpia ochracea]
MELDTDFEDTRFDEQVLPTIIHQVVTKLATKHNTHAYNQCPQCLIASQMPPPGPLTRPHPIAHPSKCKDCRSLLKTELDDLEQQLQNLKINLDFLEEAPWTPIGRRAEIVRTLDFLVGRRKVLKEQVREPCSYSIPFPPYMAFKQGKYRAMQVLRLDPRYSPHQHQGNICNFGGMVGSAQWMAANLVLRRGWSVMPGLRQQKTFVKPVWDREEELKRQKERERQIKRQIGNGG